MDKQENKSFWNNRAETEGLKESATSNEKYLRDLEIKTIIEYLRKFNPKKIYDIGCGNGFSTFFYAEEFAEKTFVGLDYAQNMIASAKERLGSLHHNNLTFDVGDITNLELASDSADFIMTSRVFINLQNFDNQIKAVKECSRVLKPGGHLLLLESVSQSYENLNKYRKKYGLSELKPHAANFYIDEDRFLNETSTLFKIEEINNFSNLYYLGSRIAYHLINNEETSSGANTRANEFFAEITPEDNCGREKIYILTNTPDKSLSC